MQERSKNIASVCVVCGTVVLTVVQVKNYIDAHVILPKLLYDAFLFLGIGLFVAAVVAVIVGSVPLDRRVEPIYDAELATEAELADLHEFCCGLVPGAFAPLSVWKERFKKNPALFYIVRESKPGFRKQVERVVGSFSLVPISKTAQAALDLEKITGADLMASDIVARSATPAAIYLSWVLAQGFRSKSHTLSLLNEKLRVASKGRSITLYTKPSSDDGLRLVKRYGFVPVNVATHNKKNVVCKCELTGGHMQRTKRSRGLADT